jgi:hypothetical protein
MDEMTGLLNGHPAKRGLPALPQLQRRQVTEKK